MGIGTTFSVYIELIGDIVGNAYLSAGVVILPRTGSNGILSRIGA